MAAAPTFTVIGKPIPRIDGPDKVTGRAKYSADYIPAGTLWGKNVRSPYPHARILSIDTSRAKALPGVRAVLTAADIPPTKLGRSISDYEVFCTERVRYIGDVVAALAADTLEIAEAAALLVDVEYEELPFVNDPIQAMQPDSPEIHPEVRSYKGFPDVPEGMRNVCSYVLNERGDLEAGFAQADVVVENTYATQLMHQGYIEPHASLVEIGENGRVEVWTTHKVPFALKNELAQIFDRSPEEIHLHQVYIGGEFGAKANPQDVPAAYYLALATGRPVKFVMPGREDLTATTPRHGCVITMRTGAKRDGTITAWDARIAWNSGAYGGVKPPFFAGNLGGSNNAAGWWDIPNVRIEAKMVYTNQVPCAYMRAPGQPQAVFAAEMQIDAVAQELRMDRLAIRLQNLPEKNTNGQDIVARQILDQAAQAVGWSAPKAKWVGRGLGFGARGTGAGASTSDITLNSDGTLTVVSSVPDSGTSGHTVVAQVVAETWGIPLERVFVIHGDTDSVPSDVGSGGSSITNSAGHAAIAASEQLQNQLAPLAAATLGAQSAEYVGTGGSEALPPSAGGSGALPPRGGWKGDNLRFISVEEFAREVLKSDEPLAHTQVTKAPERSPNQQYCAQAAEVEVDPETGHVKIRKLVAVNDVGTIINEIGHQGQIDGSLVQGVGYALMEELVVEDGRITTANLGDYKMPTIQDIPDLDTINVRTTGPGPFEAKGIGETPTVPTAAAIASAVADAIGRPIRRLPLTPERVLNALEGRR